MQFSQTLVDSSNEEIPPNDIEAPIFEIDIHTTVLRHDMRLRLALLHEPMKRAGYGFMIFFLDTTWRGVGTAFLFLERDATGTVDIFGFPGWSCWIPWTWESTDGGRNS